MSTSSTSKRRSPARKSIVPATDKRTTDLGAFSPLDGDFLYVEDGHVWRILISSTPRIYDVRDAATDRFVKHIDESIARELLARKWDVYQRVVT